MIANVYKLFWYNHSGNLTTSHGAKCTAALTALALALCLAAFAGASQRPVQLLLKHRYSPFAFAGCPMLPAAPPAGHLAALRQQAEALPPSQRTVVLLHLHKSAGTLLCNLARRNGEGVSDPYYNCLLSADKRLLSQDSLCSLVRAAVAARSTTFFSIEYQSLPDCIINDPRFLLITSFRAPRARLVSHFVEDAQEWRQLFVERSFKEWRGLIDAGALPTDIGVDGNLAVRMLSHPNGLGEHMRCIGDAHVARAASILDRFSLVLDTSRMDAGLACLGRMFGWNVTFSREDEYRKDNMTLATRNKTVDWDLVSRLTVWDEQLMKHPQVLRRLGSC